MQWLKELAHSLSSILRRSQNERELSEELQFHLERQIERNLADAATDLGASRLRVLWDVHLRLVFPACVSAWTTTFISCVTNLSIAIFLVTPGTQVATFSILGLIGDNRLEAASALTTALLAATLLVVAVAWRASRGARLVPGVVGV